MHLHVKSLVGDTSVRGVSGARRSVHEQGAGYPESTEFLGQFYPWTRRINRSGIRAGSTDEHFDKVCVIYEGKMVYFGPVNRARQYFINMGYEPANRQTTADFLIAGASHAHHALGLRGVCAVRGARVRRVFQAVGHCMAEPRGHGRIYGGVRGEAGMHEFKKSTKVEHAKHSNKKSPVIMSIPMQALALMDRRVQIIRGGIAAQVIQLASFTVQATIMGTVFLQLNSTTFAFFSPSGVLLFSLVQGPGSHPGAHMFYRAPRDAAHDSNLGGLIKDWTTGTGNTTCASTQLDWYVSIAGESPCITYQRLRQICNRDYEVPTMRLTPPGTIATISRRIAVATRCQLDTQSGDAGGIDAGAGAYQSYLAQGGGTMCAPNTNHSLQTNIQSAVCNENIHLANFLYGLFWGAGSWFYVYSKETAERDQAASNNLTFANCPNQNLTSSSSSTTSSSSSTSPTALNATVTSAAAPASTSTSSTTPPQKSISNLSAIVGGAVGGGLGLLIVVLTVLLWRRRLARSMDFRYGMREPISPVRQIPGVTPFSLEHEHAAVMSSKIANETRRLLASDSALRPSSGMAGSSLPWVVPRNESQRFHDGESTVSAVNGSALGALPAYKP
ncbi:hypothetical protein A0H81_01435 [Grifola frondosa]|uniref:Uncharacterized protein n=1 Tax=Grifola frondosa TaxID=5627 RepID=A0A1C7MXZ2_GRIFR|nr:hypothetical protein A0H81_01435 [Grifola frondosa]